MTILMLNNDIFFNIFKDIKITKLNILELSNKNLNNKVKDYLEYIYKNDYKIIKAKFNIYDSNIYYLNTLLYKNINLFDKFIYYSDNIYFKKLIKKSFSIYNLNKFENKDVIYKIINIYYKLFDEIIMNIRTTYLIFLDINKYERYKNVYTMYINKLNSYKNLFNFIKIFKILKYLNFNKII
tara:strand:- start:683 stop:1228 length:546 start_codon:yes stop_codon:yes gene_type:complete